ncbi:hypothetical protein GCM10009837_66990 [Streptomyces durmitorensis]
MGAALIGSADAANASELMTVLKAWGVWVDLFAQPWDTDDPKQTKVTCWGCQLVQPLGRGCPSRCGSGPLVFSFEQERRPGFRRRSRCPSALSHCPDLPDLEVHSVP